MLNPWNIDALQEIERETGRRVNTVLQLRLHPSVNALRERIRSTPPGERLDVTLTYVTARGHWYLSSWKGDEARSGGIATNIGVHFFDMLHYVFGALEGSALHLRSPTAAAGHLTYERARVRWFLSIDERHVPEAERRAGARTHRSLRIGDEAFEFSGGFADLHTRTYEQVLRGEGYGLEENRVAVETVAAIRNLAPETPAPGEGHPLLEHAAAHGSAGGADA